MRNEKKGRIVLVTGNRGSGKTTLCRLLADEARARGWRIGGVSSPPRFEDEQKTAIELEDLSSGERFLLARSDRETPAEVRTEQWLFDPQALVRGNQILQSVGETDLLVVDELGPLELERGEGWQAGLKAVDAGGYQVALVVVRPELLSVLRKRWPASTVVTLHTVMQTPALVKSLAEEWFD
jgi:nucleoside-triphosphatase THEP1